MNAKNPLKRFVQRRRLVSALSSIPYSPMPTTIVDYGGGNGELSARLASRFPEARVLCFEPTDWLRRQADATLRGFQNTEIVDDAGKLPQGTCDLVFCLEVFEHLPPAETAEALKAISALLRPDGTAVISVPNEIHLVALFKGIFRLVYRQRGDYDARVRNIVGAIVGRPPTDRPVDEIAAGVPYHFRHMGFDFRELRRGIERLLRVEAVSGSPFPWLGIPLSSEVYFTCRKIGAD